MVYHNIRRLAAVIKRDGYRVAIRKVRNRLLGINPAAAVLRSDAIGYYEFILGEEQGFGLKLTPENLPWNSMTWVIPDFEAQSGGHINIFRMIGLLQQRGFPNQHIVIAEPHRWLSAADAQAAIARSFGGVKVTVSLGMRSIEPSHFLVATGWQTAYWVAKYKDAVHRIYFVQDFEPFFNAPGSEYYFAENTYRLGLTGVTAGPWLARKLADEYGMETFSYSFACDTDHYVPRPKPVTNKKRISFYARPVTQRRCFELGLLALKRVCAAVPDAEVIFYGWDVSNYDIDFPHQNRGAVSVADLPELIAQSDVGLILSATNLSLMPLEVAACARPVVMNDGPHSSWLLSRDHAIYCDMTVEGIAAALIDVLLNPEQAKERVDAALRFSRSVSWEAEADKVAGFLRSKG